MGRPCRYSGGGQRQFLLGSAGGKCQRQLGQGGAAHSGAHRHRQERMFAPLARRHERGDHHRHRQAPLHPPSGRVLISRMADAVHHEAHVYDSKVAEWAVLLGSMAGVLMQALDTTIANVALPYMMGELSATYEQITWVLTSYIIAAAIMTAPVGWLAGRFGKKKLLITSIAGFPLASMLCGAATSLSQMVLFRLIQGVFGAALGPLSQAVMLDMYPPQKRGSVMAIWGMGVMLGPILGPTLGGFLTDAYNSRWVFYINVPFGIAACVMLAIFFKDTARNTSLKFDWFGFTAFAIGLAGLQLILDRGTTKDWFSSAEI